MQKVLSITNKYMILATPLILYSLITSIYLVSSLSAGRLINLIFGFILLFFMTSAFLSGWFNMIKLAISTPERDDTNSLIKEFIPGVGEYFLSTSGALLIILIMFFITIAITSFVGSHLIGDMGISSNDLVKAMQSQTALKSFILGLNPEQMNKILSWNLLITFTTTCGSLLVFLYMPVLFLKTKNPILAFWYSLKSFFSKKIFKTIGVYLLIFIAYFFISILSAIFGSNIIGHFAITLLNFYFIIVAGVGVFYYYYNNFIKTKLGQNVDVEI